VQNVFNKQHVQSLQWPIRHIMSKKKQKKSDSLIIKGCKKVAWSKEYVEVSQ